MKDWKRVLQYCVQYNIVNIARHTSMSRQVWSQPQTLALVLYLCVPPDWCTAIFHLKAFCTLIAGGRQGDWQPKTAGARSEAPLTSNWAAQPPAVSHCI